MKKNRKVEKNQKLQKKDENSFHMYVANYEKIQKNQEKNQNYKKTNKKESTST